MEPVHYLRALRRRWWVIVAAVAVASGAAWFFTPETVDAVRSATPEEPAAYTATTVLWNTGAPTIGQGSPITSLEALAQVVTLPGPTAIAAKDLDYDGDMLVLSSQVKGSVNEASGFLNITATSPTPERAVAVSSAFSEALLTYLQRLNIRRIDQQQIQVEEQIRTLELQQVDPTIIASLREGLSLLALSRTAPVPITTIQRATAIPVSTVAPADDGGFTAPESRTVRTLLGALIGLLAGIVLALVLERFDTKIRSARAAEEAFGLPVLAEVPAIPRRRRGKVVTASYPYSRAADAFRLIGVGASRWSSNGKGTDKPKEAETVLVTSPEARDGKTTVAANLAVALAQSGKRVLVVSCDLRRPAIHDTFGVSLRPGLTDALYASNGNRDPEAPFDLAPYLEPCSIVRVAVLPSGVTPERPGELLGSPNMQALVRRLKRLTDVVILDCAPLVVASDVVPLLPLADGVVLVARAGKTRRELAANAATLLERLGADTAGVVLNDARDFAIPLPKRKVYAPTRKMRKEAARAAATPQRVAGPPPAQRPKDAPAVVEPRGSETSSAVEAPARSPSVEVPEPETEVQIPEVSPTGDERGGGGPSLSATEPERTTSSVAQLVARERTVVVPPVELPADEAPWETSSSLESLEQQLAAFRALLREPNSDGDAETEATSEPRPDRRTDVG